jgi:hypothetical protein
MSYSVLILIVVGISHLILGGYVLIKNYQKTLNRLFFVSTIAFSIWNLAMAVMLSEKLTTSFLKILFDRLTYFSIPFILIFLIFYFRQLDIKDYIKNLKTNRIVQILIGYGLINLFLISMTNLISANQGSDEMLPGRLYF